MGRIHVLSETVANKIAAGEVVERPASVVKELLENSLDAGATRVRVQVEAGGKRLIQVTDNGSGMLRDDALLAFERHATSKIKNADDLLGISTLGFRGEALPSIASVSRLRLETRAPEEPSGSIVEIAGGKILRVEEAGLPQGTAITVRDLFFNIPARRKFLKAETTELSHIASLVTHYSLAHPEKHFELHSTTGAMLVAAPVASHAERIYQIFGKDTLDSLLPIAAARPIEHSGLPAPPPWATEKQRAACEAATGLSRREDADPEDDAPAGSRSPGDIRLHGFASKPAIQKLNRNSIFVFVNGRLIRDRLIQHALTEAYRNILPPTVFPVVLLFLELPNSEVDANVHPAKTEVRFRQQNFVHDFVRDAVRDTLMKARPVPHFTSEIRAHPTASQALSPGALPPSGFSSAGEGGFALRPPGPPPMSQRFSFDAGTAIAVAADASRAVATVDFAAPLAAGDPAAGDPAAVTAAFPAEAHGCAPEIAPAPEADVEPAPDALALATLKPLGQVRDSFILAVNAGGLWIIDQHVAHERVLFERILRQRAAARVESQQMLMPLVIELTPGQQAVFAELSGELQLNGFDVEPFGARTVAIKTAPAGVDAAQVERMLHELLDQFYREDQALNLEKARARIAASIACHAAIKVNMPLEQQKMEWLLSELAKTECPMSCPHGRPVVLRYSLKDIQRAFKRI
ncbi:MAG TPA: DNA mismatch repair endonuclease MutL [Terriglobales bacterium]|nr:DNA mismatch repair endonuclease MutL [Terriglobales bacterium]